MKLRVARHTNNIEIIKRFYIDVLGFEILGEFKNHDHYDGVFIGAIDADWHLEFTTSNEPAIHSFDPDDLLVFYSKSVSEYTAIINRINRLKIDLIRPKNRYWQLNGTVIKDPDGYLIVIVNKSDEGE